MKNVGKFFALIALLAFGNLISLNAFPSEMATSGCFRTYSPLKEFYENGLTPQLASQKFCVDEEFRKKVQRKYALILIQALDTIIADTARIRFVRIDDGERVTWYDTGKIFPKEVVFLDDDSKKWGYVNAASVYVETYPNTTIAKVYAKLRKKRIKQINIYSGGFPNYMGDFIPLDFLNKVFPVAMPTKDYSAFLDYDYGAKIAIKLSKNELETLRKEGFSEEAIQEYQKLEIGESDGFGGGIFWWDFGVITWADSSRMLFEFDECSGYYFKQVGDDVWLINLHYQCV